MASDDDLNSCPECGSENVVHSRRTNSIICKDCGAETPLNPEDDQFAGDLE